MTRYAPRGSYPSARSLACSFADGDRWICALKESGRPRDGLWRIAYAPSSALGCGAARGRTT
jgi:hypothetical protein